jgi:16S rRNA (cytosine967-C5)-methyltransferase
MQINGMPLWRQLQATVDVVDKVAQGRSANEAIAAVSADIRPAAQALAFHVWRNLGCARHIRQRLAQKAPPPWVNAALCCGLALLQSHGTPQYDEFTLVDQLVEAVKRRTSAKHQAPFVNACLRRYLRERTAIDAQCWDDPEARWNYPAWWIQRVQRDHPHSWERILAVGDTPAHMTLRINRRQTTQAQYLQMLESAEIPAWAHGQSAISLGKAVAVPRLPDFIRGLVSVQDAGAQTAAELLLQGFVHSKDTRILDACAAPGGKTGHLLELSDAHVVAVEVDTKRATRISENLARLKLHAEVKNASVLDRKAWWDGQLFDLILLDAPCTASGIVRRHPDVRWLRRETDIEALAVIQRDMLKAMWEILRPGGRLLYCTCSIFAEEGAEQCQAFLANNKDARLLPSPGHMLPTHAVKAGLVAHNGDIDHDGFFYALFEKNQT